MQDFESVIELLGMLATNPRSMILFTLLLVAAVIDYRSYRIPNWLTFSGAAIGLLYSAFNPGVTNHGLLWSLAGLGIGFIVMLPMYALKIMGAGDVKLMAMVGSLLGYTGILPAVLCTFLAGGATALVCALFRRVLGQMLLNIKEIANAAAFSIFGGIPPNLQVQANLSVGKLPYGVSIALGTLAYVLANQLGYL